MIHKENRIIIEKLGCYMEYMDINLCYLGLEKH